MTKARDPICGMTVEVEKAPARSVYPTGTVYFCSVGCKQKYDSTHGASRP